MYGQINYIYIPLTTNLIFHSSYSYNSQILHGYQTACLQSLNEVKIIVDIVNKPRGGKGLTSVPLCYHQCWFIVPLEYAICRGKLFPERK